ncbi:hypothetical protein GQ457_02G032890 [Hibiscus cannabinus]
MHIGGDVDLVALNEVLEAPEIASLGEGKEARRIHLDLCSSTHLDCLWVIWYALVRLGGVSENLHASMKHD